MPGHVLDKPGHDEQRKSRRVAICIFALARGKKPR
jgi:hypothetical protein